MKITFKRILLLLTFIGIIILMTLSLNSTKERLLLEKEKNDKAKETTDYNKYLSAVQCVNLFLDTIIKDENEALILLNEEYKQKYNITTNNIKSFLPALSKNFLHDFKTNKIYQKKISKNVTEYYLKGEIVSSAMDMNTTYTDLDVTIVFYETDETFSIKLGIEDLKL